MQSPCSRKLPDGCEPQSWATGQSSLDVEEDIVADIDNQTDDEDDFDYDDDVDDAAEMPAGLSTEEIALWKKKHHHKSHRRHRHKHHNHHHGKNKHPWKDLCVAVGDFCGNQLYGCNFDENSLYHCAQVGKPPVKIYDRNFKCSKPPVDNCVCPGTGTDPVCGFLLDPSCNADPHTIYYCPNGKSSRPVPFQQCPPGLVCIKQKSPIGAACGSGSCECNSDVTVCSSQFPPKCGYPLNAVLKCSGTGTTTVVETCSEGGGCVSAPDGATCVNGCNCQVTGDVCGGAFPAICRIPADNLYTCVKGQKPQLKKTCEPGRCQFTLASLKLAQGVFDSKCTDSCTCSAKGKVCGQTFPPKCGLRIDTLYECSGPDAVPKPIEECGSGGCTALIGNDECSKDKCTCPGLGLDPVCGSELPSTCKDVKPNAIYHCIGGTGEPPEILDICPQGTKCIPKPSPIGATCGFNSCNCTGSGEYCSDQFPDECGLERNSVVKCTGGNTKPEVVKTCTGGESCVKHDDKAECRDCLCPEDGEVCGSIFPLSCRIPRTSIYTCTKDAEPIEKQSCLPGHCTSTNAALAAAAVFEAFAAKCIDGNKCQVDGLVCGSTFDESFGLDPAALYQCKKGEDPQLVEKCKFGCVVTAGGNKCAEDDCTCPSEVGTNPVCGHDLPASCKAQANTIYHCPGGHGTRPEILSICTPGSQCQNRPAPDGAVCGFADCNCTGSGEFCSNQFPDKCDLPPNTVVKCQGNKLVPGKTCDEGKTCVALPDGAYCANCLCQTDGIVCGSSFPLNCKLSHTSQYTCKKGSEPVFYASCLPGTCISSKSQVAAASLENVLRAFDEQCSNSCHCQDNSKVCGHTFPEFCGLEKHSLYNCNGKDTEPELAEECTTSGCKVNAGDDECLPQVCTCPGDGRYPVCGFELPPECNAIDTAVYTCPGGAGSNPEIAEICPPGLACQTRPSPVGAVCGYQSCNCTGTGQFCSESFPDSCGLPPNAVVECKGSGTEPETVEECSSSEHCLRTETGAICTESDCKCQKDGEFCGSVFGDHCHLSATTLYSCTEGEYPVEKEECLPGRCVVTDPTDNENDRCADPCICTSDRDVCGSTFPPQCGLPPNTLYSCREGSRPEAIGNCPGGCAETAPDNTCQESDCTCPGYWPVCGHDLPASCNAKPNTIYHCPGGTGDQPQVLEICKPGVVCLSKPPPVGAVCGFSGCNCTGSDEFCSEQFGDECNLPPNSIVKCTGDGTPEVVETCDKSEECVSLPDDAICADCICDTTGDVCGDSFPSTCRVDKTSIYTCVEGQPPVLKESCLPGFCATTSGDAKCLTEEDKCKCLNDNKVCGSTFDESCGLESSSLYQCNGFGSTPVKIEECENGCNPTAEDNSCNTDPCTCPGDGLTPVCGSELPPECNAEPNAIYHCPAGHGSQPELLEQCSPGTICQSRPPPLGATCGFTSCNCTGSQEHCSEQFPEECGLEPNTIVKCSSTGEIETVKTCDPSEECIAVSDGAICAPKDCTCTKDGRVCGSEFPDSCGLQHDALYTCTTGAKPVLVEECAPGTCVATTNEIVASSAKASFRAQDATCIQPCTCTGSNDVCGSTFPEDCNLNDNTLYQCDGTGSTPQVKEVCTNGCNVTADNNQCNGSTDCLCEDGTPVCGHLLDPTKCTAADLAGGVNAIYYCPDGPGTPFKVLEVCDPGLECQPLPAPTGAVCGSESCNCTGDARICSNQFPADCGLQPNSVYQCSEDGTPVLVEDCGSTKECTPLADGAYCASTDCKCPDDGTICGEVFPASCGLARDALYTCVKGEDPVLLEVCAPANCHTTFNTAAALSARAQAVFKGLATTDKCDEPCTCGATSGLVCGSTFNPNCGLNPDGVYQCSGDGGAPVLVEQCNSGECIVAPGDDHCKPPEPTTTTTTEETTTTTESPTTTTEETTTTTEETTTTTEETTTTT
ncbi:hypothetical protein BGW41_005939, partial [Actinomortierella wolfii]